MDVQTEAKINGTLDNNENIINDTNPVKAATACCNGDAGHNHEQQQGEVATAADGADSANAGNNDSELILIHDNAFTIKIHVPGLEPFDLQVSRHRLT